MSSEYQSSRVKMAQPLQIPTSDFSSVEIPKWYEDLYHVEYGRSREPMPKEPLAAVWHIVCCLWHGIVWFWLKVRTPPIPHLRPDWCANTQKRLWAWYRPKDSRDAQFDAIIEAREYEDWVAAAEKLDRAFKYDEW
jgi:hypothetical protein